MIDPDNPFNVEVGVLPASAAEFSRRPIKPGTPALVITHEQGPWTTAAYDEILDGQPNVKLLGTRDVEGTTIQTGLTTSKGSTVQADGTVVEWERPALAYYPASLDSLLVGEEENGSGTLYLFAR